MVPKDSKHCFNISTRIATYYLVFNPVRTGGGGIFYQFRGFLPITFEVIKVHSRKLVTFPEILMPNTVKVTNFQN